MKIENSYVIRAKADTCNVSRNGDTGRISVGSVLLDADEAADFVQTLATVLAQITAPKEEKP